MSVVNHISATNKTGRKARKVSAGWLNFSKSERRARNRARKVLVGWLIYSKSKRKARVGLGILMWPRTWNWPKKKSFVREGNNNPCKPHGLGTKTLRKAKAYNSNTK